MAQHVAFIPSPLHTQPMVGCLRPMPGPTVAEHGWTGVDSVGDSLLRADVSILEMTKVNNLWDMVPDWEVMVPGRDVTVPCWEVTVPCQEGTVSGRRGHSSMPGGHGSMLGGHSSMPGGHGSRRGSEWRLENQG